MFDAFAQTTAPELNDHFNRSHEGRSFDRRPEANMICGPDTPVAACREIQYSFGIATIILAFCAVLAEVISSRYAVKARPGIQDVPQLGESVLDESDRRNAWWAERRMLELTSAAWMSLALALTLASILCALTINFPWLWRFGAALIVLASLTGLASFAKYQVVYRERLEWLRDFFQDDMKAGVILQAQAVSLLEQILTLSNSDFKKAKHEVCDARTKRASDLKQRSANRQNS